MATIENGTYIVRSGAHLDNAINGGGDFDSNGENIWAYKFQRSDASYVTVINHDDGTIRMLLPATGLTIDVYCGGDNAYVVEGQNVREWEYNTSRAQKWNVVAVEGKTYTVDGVAYQAYKLQMPGTINGKTWDMCTASTSQTVNNTSVWNIQITADKTDDSVNWIFIPANPVVDGTYRVHPIVNKSMVLDVVSASTANGARVDIYGMNDTNAQTWKIETSSEGRTKIYAATPMASNQKKLVEVSGDDNDITNGSIVDQWDDLEGKNVNRDQQWILIPESSTTYGNDLVPTYEIRNYAASGTGYELDIRNGQASQGLSLQLWEHNGSDAQQFVFEPYAAIDQTLGAPANVCLATVTNTHGSHAKDITANNVSGGFYCLWNCTGTTYKARYRYRTRKVGKSGFSSWSNWFSMDGNNLTAHSGTGEAWQPNLTVDDTPQKHTPAKLTRVPTVDNITYDCVEVCSSIRRFETEWSKNDDMPAQGAEIVTYNKLCWTPNVTVSKVTWSPDGLIFSYTSDYKRSGNKIVVSNIYDTNQGTYLMSKSQTFTNCSYTGIITVSQDNLKFVPDENDSLRFTFKLVTDISQSTNTDTINVVYDTNTGLSISPTYTVSKQGYVEVTVPKHAADNAYLMYYDSRNDLNRKWQVFERSQYKWTSGNNWKIEIYPPLGMAFSIYVFSKDSSDNWGTDYKEFEPLKLNQAFTWNWIDRTLGWSAEAALYHNVSGAPSISDEMSSDKITYNTPGRLRPRYYMENTVARKLSVDGIIYADEKSDYPYATVGALKELEEVHYALFRAYNGVRAWVAVEKVTFDRSKPGYTSVSVSQYEDNDNTGVLGSA